MVGDIRKKISRKFWGGFRYLYTMNIQENVNRIKQVMGILKEETEQDLRKILQDKFVGNSFAGGTFERQGDYIIQKYFSKRRNGNGVITYKPGENFYTLEIIDGPLKGEKRKNFSDETPDEDISKSEVKTKFEEKIKNFPCLTAGHPPLYTRQTSDGKLIVGYQWFQDGGSYVIYFNLDDKTYLVKGGRFDGEQGQFLGCKGDDVKFGKVTKSGTKKNVLMKTLEDYFEDVTKEAPIVYGMRDHASEPENGLIYLLQKRLKELNLYAAEPDGQFGPKTLKAVKDFQKTGKDADGKPLVVDGKVGPNTIQALGLKD
jgi:hypothetical protein